MECGIFVLPFIEVFIRKPNKYLCNLKKVQGKATTEKFKRLDRRAAQCFELNTSCLLAFRALREDASEWFRAFRTSQQLVGLIASIKEKHLIFMLRITFTSITIFF